MKNKRIALLFVCLNEPYWPYLKSILSDCDNFFFRNKNTNYTVDYFAWTDIKEDIGATIFPTDPVPWPQPTLMRYHLFLQQEKTLKDYDYIFYLDSDMKMVTPVGEEILSDGLTMAEHPMYALRKEYYPPYEPNKDSSAYIPRFGKVIDEGGKLRFKPLYAAGGFQGGKTKEFLKAMKVMKKSIDEDFLKNNYIAIWNDESHWNKYLSEYKGPLTVLSPSYIYPDSLINEYYIPRWGKNYEPKIITLTKPFSVSKEGGAAINEYLGVQTEKLVQNKITCPTCSDDLIWEGYFIEKVIECPGKGKPHQVQVRKV